jgi:hypothetical protein
MGESDCSCELAFLLELESSSAEFMFIIIFKPLSSLFVSEIDLIKKSTQASPIK